MYPAVKLNVQCAMRNAQCAIAKQTPSIMDTLKKRSEEITYLEDPVTCKADIAYITMMLQKSEHNIIIIKNHSDDIIQHVLNNIDDDRSGHVFFWSEIMLNPIQNCMVPKHREATSQEIDYLLSRKIPLEKLPILLMKDPIRRWHNFKINSIVAIERSDDLYFRRVV